jgi:beta-phosphoglucomutase-like phosphatase (HAD superfamily)
MGCIHKATGRLISATLFDMDGVLVDSIPIHLQSWNNVFAELGYPDMTSEQYLRSLGRTNAAMLNTYCKEASIVLTPSELSQILIRKEAVFRENMERDARPTPGLVAWLDFFNHLGILCSVASSGTMANIAYILNKLGIADYFASTVSGMKFHASKPDPHIFLMAAASLGIQARECLVVEDAPMGIQAAKAADMLCCAIATSYPREEIASADIILESLAEVDPSELFMNNERKK